MTRLTQEQTIQEKWFRFLHIPHRMEGYGKLPESDTFAVIGATIADNFDVKMPEGTIGASILDELK